MPRRVRSRLAKKLREAIDEAVETDPSVLIPGGNCGAPKKAVPDSDGNMVIPGHCLLGAGEGTGHKGYGLCKRHGGNAGTERIKGAWLVAHALARPLKVSPWDALLGEVRRSAGEVAWLDLKVGTAESDEELIGDGELAPWMRMRERSRHHLARVAKLAVDAQVDVAMVAQAQADGEQIANVIISTLTALGLDDDTMDRARSILRQKLLALEAQAQGTLLGENGVLEGELVEKE